MMFLHIIGPYFINGIEDESVTQCCWNSYNSLSAARTLITASIFTLLSTCNSETYLRLFSLFLRKY